MKCSLIFLFLLTGFVVKLVPAAQEETSSAWEENDRLGLSCLEHVVANGEAQETGEVLVRLRKSFDSVENFDAPNLDGAVIEEEQWIRYRYDFARKRFLYASIWSENRLELGLIDPVTKEPLRKLTKSRPNVFLVDSTKDHASLFQFGEWTSLSFSQWDESFDGLMKSFDAPDFRIVGISEHRWNQIESYKTGYQDAALREMRYDTRKIDNSRIKVREHLQPSGDKKRKIYTDYLFDVSTMMPVQSQSFMKAAGDTKFLPLGQKRERVVWIEKEGIFVPTYIRRTGIGEKRVRYGEREFGAVEEIMELHWFSMNREFTEADFDLGPFKSEEFIHQFLDPKKNQAQTILERMEKEKVGTVEQSEKK